MILISKKKKDKKVALEPQRLDSNKIKESHCFFMYVIQHNDSQETKSEKRKSFIEDIKRKPEENWYLDDFDYKRHYIYENMELRCIPFVNNKTVDRDCVRKSALEIFADGKYDNKYYFAYILEVIREGLIGEGCAKMTYEEFQEFMIGIDVGKKSNLQNQMPEGIYPNWRIKDPRGEIDLQKSQAAVDFAQTFILKYRSSYAYIYGTIIPVNDKTEI